MFAALGMSGPRANSGRRCGGFFRYTILSRFRVPTRGLVCRHDGPLYSELMLSDEVGMDRITRQLTSVSRRWSEPDSAHWVQAQDSLARAMERLGGQQISCNTSPYADAQGWPSRFWKFPNYYVRSYFAHWPRDRAPEEWVAQVSGFTNPPEECIRDPWGVMR